MPKPRNLDIFRLSVTAHVAEGVWLAPSGSGFGLIMVGRVGRPGALGLAPQLQRQPLTQDEHHDGSESIQNQRDLLRAYVAANPELCAGEVLEFADDGWSGTNFERPQVKAFA